MEEEQREEMGLSPFHGEFPKSKLKRIVFGLMVFAFCGLVGAIALEGHWRPRDKTVKEYEKLVAENIAMNWTMTESLNEAVEKTARENKWLGEELKEYIKGKSPYLARSIFFENTLVSFEEFMTIFSPESFNFYNKETENRFWEEKFYGRYVFWRGEYQGKSFYSSWTGSRKEVIEKYQNPDGALREAQVVLAMKTPTSYPKDKYGLLQNDQNAKLMNLKPGDKILFLGKLISQKGSRCELNEVVIIGVRRNQTN